MINPALAWENRFFQEEFLRYQRSWRARSDLFRYKCTRIPDPGAWELDGADIALYPLAELSRTEPTVQLSCQTWGGVQ